MINPNLSNIPGMNAMNDTLGFVKNLWGGMGVPGMVMPTLSVDEINKQISDLKAVEAWLNLNMNMLRGTIQALEVQSATIATLQSMGETLSAAVKSSTAAKPKAAPAPAAKPAPAQTAAPEAKRESEEPPASAAAPQANPAVWWNMLQDQFKQAVNSAMSTEPAKSLNKFGSKASEPNAANQSARNASHAAKPAAKKSVTKNGSKSVSKD